MTLENSSDAINQVTQEAATEVAGLLQGHDQQVGPLTGVPWDWTLGMNP